MCEISVSIILPVFNAMKTLEDCLLSLLSQTLENIEIICIDDNSSDLSSSILESFSYDERLKIYRNNTNKGHGFCRNLGLKKSQGIYIFNVDPDDLVSTNALYVLYEAALSGGKVDIVKGRFLKKSESFFIRGGDTCRVEEPINVQSIFKKEDKSSLMMDTTGHWSCLFLRDFISKYPYPTDLSMGTDSLFIIQAYMMAKSILCIDNVVYFYKENKYSAMNNFNKKKYKDAIEWRSRAFRILILNDFAHLAYYYIWSYWDKKYFFNMNKDLKFLDKKEVLESLSYTLHKYHKEDYKHIIFPSYFIYKVLTYILEFDFHGFSNFVSRYYLFSKLKEPSEEVNINNRQSLISNNKKILALSSLDKGGAAVGSKYRVEALKKTNPNIKLYSAFSLENRSKLFNSLPLEMGVEKLGEHDWYHFFHIINKKVFLSKESRKEFFSNTDNIFDTNNIPFVKFEEFIKKFDIVHFHWVVGLVDYSKGVKVFKEKPIVWTMADMNPFTGGCHYSYGCKEYKNECSSCHYLDNNTIARNTWHIKNHFYKNIKNIIFIAPSYKLYEMAKESSLLREKQVLYIPNIFPYDRYKPINYNVAKLKLGLPLDKKVILFTAENLSSERKNIRFLLDVLERMRRLSLLDNIIVIFMGHGDINLPSVNYKNLGFIHDDNEKSIVYSASDILLFPSKEDNSPLVVTEAMSCGTGVVSFPVGDLGKLIKHRYSGYLSNSSSVIDFIEGINYMLRQDKLLFSLRVRKSLVSFLEESGSILEYNKVYQSFEGIS